MVKDDSLPNIVIFFADEMRGDALSLGGKRNSVIKTPNLNKLAQDGAAFTNCFTVNPVCAPSRCCTFTGQYVHSNNHRSLYQLLQGHEENLFKFLKKKGYEVIWIGRNDLFSKKAERQSVDKRIPIKWPEGSLEEIKKRIKINPFSKKDKMYKSFYYGERNQEQAQDQDVHFIRSALEYIESPHDNPFCLYIALNFPHPPYTVEEPYFSMYDRKKVPAPIPPKLNDKPEFMRIMHERYNLDKLSEDDFREILATYYGMISRVDSQLGEVTDKLKEQGLYDNTAIFFSSDHGDYAGNFGLTEKWPNSFHECLINVPLIVRIPGIKPEEYNMNQLVQTIDIFPTILDLASIDTNYTHFGRNLLPLMKGEVKEIRDAVFAEGGYNPREPQCFEDPVKSPDIPLMGAYYDKTNIPLDNPSTVQRSAMIRTKKWKYILRMESSEEELYDLWYDRIESTNLNDVDSYDRVKTELREKLLRWYLETSDNPHWKKKRNL